MPALAADIAAGTRLATISSWSNATIKTRYPNARDGSAEVAEGFFDAATDCDTALTARGALIGTERRRFVVPVGDLLWIDPASGLPTYTLVDVEQAANGAFLLARYELDLEAETTTLELYG